MKIKLIIIFMTIAILLGVSTGGYLAVNMGLPSIQEIKQYRPAAGTKIYADDDVLIGELKVF